ncbi:MAG: methylmalonyl-CoA epimerase [Deltaproteobacteria bacterium]|nr:methylmalonyl-CoA epimerase [Deltaproteobacteria bacterium]
MTAKKISHVGIAVPNIDEYLSIFKDTLGFEFQGTEEVADQKVKVAFLKVGESRFELLEPTADDSPVKKYLDKNDNKPRFHHVAIEVDDLTASLEKAKSDGLQLIDETPRTGAGGAQIAFLHPKSTAGVLTELCQHHEDH